MKHYNIKPENTAIIGDKLGMDMWGGYVSEITHRILVKKYKRVK